MGNRKNKSRSQKRKFIGNRYTERTKSLDVPTVSEQKLNTTSVSFENIPSKDDKMSGNRIFDVEILHSVFSCLCCPSCLSVNLQLTEDSIFGLSSGMTLKCKKCMFVYAFQSTRKANKMNDINLQFVWGMRIIGKGHSSSKKLCASLNIPSVSKAAYKSCEKKLLNVASVVSKNAMIEASDEIRKLKNTSDVAECGVSVDGTWQRRGHSSLNGCVAVLSIDTGKVVDLEVMSK
ncbi:uncharacterized protein TNCV_1595391 [Trichonephila clavipes]|nr:uncharacterized protein TNCV_1595391 [Trichonephila clavipes]